MPAVVIEYQRDVPARDGRRAFLRGERYVVASVAAAQRYHPDAVILAYEDGAPYHASTTPVREERRERPQRRRA
jgi:hypothetical protein